MIDFLDHGREVDRAATLPLADDPVGRSSRSTAGTPRPNSLRDAVLMPYRGSERSGYGEDRSRCSPQDCTGVEHAMSFVGG
jgi:hypothetical protein